MPRIITVVMGLITVLATVSAGAADDAFFRVDVRDLELTDGKLPDFNAGDVHWRIWGQLRDSMTPYAVLDNEGEIYVSAEMTRGSRRDEMPDHVVVRAVEGQAVTGRLFWPKRDMSGMVALRFEIPASDADSDDRDDFYRAKLRHYNNLLNRGVAGAAWFRHQTREARKELKSDSPDQRRAVRRGQADELSDTYALFSGGRAMSENLQLDRVLPEPRDSDKMVELDSIRGITVPDIDWSELTKGLDPDLDPLADKIPFDQHAVFFPSFNAFVTVIDEVKADSGLVLQALEPRGEDAGTFTRYEQQLGLSITAVSRLLGPRLAKSVAMTGSDPYFRTGTDVAYLFEAVDADTLETALVAQISVAAGKVGSAERVRGKVNGVKYIGFSSPDRRICSYVASFGDTVVVTNSTHQLEQLANTHRGDVNSIASLAEYKYFRDRYKRDDPNETAFVFLSDATIRRWCGPRWRILSSRRTRDMAVISELQAGQMDRLAKGGFQSGPIYTDLPLAAKGELTLDTSGVHSQAVGSLAFMTPIAEMPISKVTETEAGAYRRWRDGYERNWTGVFDPIGLRLGIRKDKLSADLTVMPLIGGSDYREMVDVSRGAKIAADAGDPHDALAHVVMAINKDSETVKRFGNFAQTMTSAKINPLGWLGNSVALYFDDDPLWREMAGVAYDERDRFFRENLGRFPVALVAEVESAFKLTAFLATFRAFIEQTSPGMTQWESLTYKDEPYVKITPTERARSRTGEIENLAVYYSASAESLIVTLSPDVLKRALDRRIARRKAEKEDDQMDAEPFWLGESLCLKVDARALAVLSAVFAEDYQLQMQKRAWDNLPILNEWKRRYPGRDAIELHEQIWKVQLVDPAGGRYTWNAKWRTMESSIYGHPGKPKKGPAAPPLVAGITGGNFGVTFENDGLRTQVELDRKP
ncbi:MAG: hypothetical protein H8E44_23545 [Planctomycetes bacterium]|nr:hypothetical protein [Planctomycetota bacterium]MBL7040533.1 hypothetical protein [Pirellulaceae bacterium]